MQYLMWEVCYSQQLQKKETSLCALELDLSSLALNCAWSSVSVVVFYPHKCLLKFRSARLIWKLRTNQVFTQFPFLYCYTNSLVLVSSNQLQMATRPNSESLLQIIRLVRLQLCKWLCGYKLSWSRFHDNLSNNCRTLKRTKGHFKVDQLVKSYAVKKSQ